MDEATLQAILNSLPPKEPRSRLEPYSALITEMRRRGRSYKEIAQVLADKCQVKVAPSTVFDFVRVRAKAKPSRKKTVETNAPPPTQEKGATAAERIAALKQRPVEAKSQEPVFHYEETEPLRLKPSTKEEKTENPHRRQAEIEAQGK